ncbi:hypothetical protein ADL12_44670 [Streptomyces regalis]|uniref:Uncharacterized protein n=1 Tax=Streptomyces regalis TaxID=68262 RepID=A0A101J761_9ACTN|nr:hypothetical protein ADL12_44670 [Streptomyces regalis]
MKRHYTRTITGFKCCACRQEFSSSQEFAKHCAKGGECRKPVTLGFYIDVNIHPYYWTGTKPECYQRTA